MTPNKQQVTPFAVKFKRRIKKAVFRLLPGNEPDFLVIGAQKSGTSSLHHWLKQHPQLIGSNPKEIHYFDKMVHYDYSVRWYENHFKRLPFTGKKLFFESTPGYLYYENVAQSIFELYPTIKLILVLRNPVDRAFSAYNMLENLFLTKGKEYWARHSRHPDKEDFIYRYLVKNRTTFPSLSEAIAIEEKIIREKGPTLPAILRMGLYYDSLSEYLKYFKKEQIHIIGFKDLILYPAPAVERICHFLDIKPVPVDQWNLAPRNSGNYSKIIDNKTRSYLERFYEPYNEKLFRYTGGALNW